MEIKEPANNPCGSCPYRRDVPSGIWDRTEYLKLPAYDNDTAAQPPSVFLCHQQNIRVCAGWCGTHDMAQNLAVRFAGMLGTASSRTINAILDYKTETPLFSSGKEACKHGLKEVKKPSEKARITISKLLEKRNAES